MDVSSSYGEQALRNANLKNPPEMLKCTFVIAVGRSGNGEGGIAAAAAKGQELCSIAHVLSKEQLTEIWIPEAGIKCCSIEMDFLQRHDKLQRYVYGALCIEKDSTRSFSCGTPLVLALTACRRLDI